MKQFRPFIRVFLLFFVHLIFFIPLSLRAQDTQLLDAEKKAQLDVQVEFKQFTSCENMESVLEKFLDKLPQRRYRKDRDIFPLVGSERGLPEAGPMKVGANPTDTSIASSSTDYSQTNVQKANVDEPDIIKTNGEYIFYYNQQEKKISIIRSPLDRVNAKLKMENAEEVNVIMLPEQFENVNLFASKTRLAIIATRYTHLPRRSLLDKNTRTIVAIYDITNPKELRLLKFSDVDGFYVDARLINHHLYVISNLNINWRDWYVLPLKERKKVTSKKLLPHIIDRTKQRTAGVMKKITPSCKEISYILPSEKTIEEFDLYPSFTIIAAIDINNTTQSPTMYVLFGNQGQIHMSEKNLYLVQNLWIPFRRRCPWIGRCLMPYREEGQQTLVHKFEVRKSNIRYKATNMVQGTPLTQYSMDEDEKGNFRILTKKSRTEGTNLYIFDESLRIRGKLIGIQPGEQFKASRYIGDKLYLVTFVQTDPFFVIDVGDVDNPKIIGELKIPGFSTYLHPLGSLQNEKQYLIGLGYDTSVTQRGGVVTSGIKLDMYEVDYAKQQVGGNDDCNKYTSETCPSYCDKKEPKKVLSKICTSTGCVVTSSAENAGTCVSKAKTGDKKTMISVRQLFTITLGGKGSDSEVLNNPRLFVIDKNNVVTIPVVLKAEVSSGQSCNVIVDASGRETKTDCYPLMRQVTLFVGMKSFKFDVRSGIKEVYSVDYAPILKQLYVSHEGEEEYRTYRLRNLGMRVGYVGDALYMINADFGHFFVPGTKHEKYLMFDKMLQQ